MKRSGVHIIVVVISVSLLGLLIIQAYWIHKSIRFAEKQFDENVYRSLIGLNEELEQREIAHFLGPDLSSQPRLIRTKVCSDSLNPEEHRKEVFVWNDSSETDHRMIVINDFESDTHREQRIEIRLNERNRDSLHLEQLVHDAHNELSYNLEHIMEDKTKKIEEVMVKLMVQDNKHLHERINLDSLESKIRKQLLVRGINIDFDYLVQHDFSKQPDKVKGDTAVLIRSPYKTILFASDFNPSHARLMIHFPQKMNHLLEQIWWVILVSVLFILIISFTFYYTIRSMIRQKKIADLKNDFVSNMTHELKTPITSINLACETMSDADFAFNEATVRNYIGIIAQENDRLEILVNNVLESSFFGSDQIKLNLEKVDLSLLIQNEADRFAMIIKKKEGVLTCNFPEGNYFVHADVFHMANVIRNLIDNAIKYSAGRLDIQINLTREKEFILLEVRDHGIGIPRNQQAKIFDKFHRVQKGNVHNVKGYGLGLYYVKRMMDLHGGMLEVRSTPGQGSSFMIRFPNEC